MGVDSQALGAVNYVCDGCGAFTLLVEQNFATFQSRSHPKEGNAHVQSTRVMLRGI